MPWIEYVTVKTATSASTADLRPWQSRIKRLFEAAGEKPPEERESYLAGLAGLDSGLREEVERLLGADRDDSFLQGLPAGETTAGR